jgi:phage gp29-like protein
MATLFDQYGRPIETSRRPDDRHVAVARLADRWSTYPSRGLTPERLAAILREADEGDVSRQCELFAEMEEKDAHLASVLQTRKLAVQGLSWSVEPSAADDPEAVKDAELVKEVLEQLDFEDLVLDLMDAVGKGFSVAEILWQTGDRAVPSSIEWIDPKRFRWDDANRLRLVTDASPVDGELLPANKFIVHRYKARSGSPSRAGMLRVCAWMYLFKNYDLKDWVQFVEVFGMPLRIGKYDPSASKDDKDHLLQAIMAIAANAAGIIPSNADIQFVEAQRGSSADVYEKLAEYCDRAMSKAILGQTLTTDTSGSTGTFAAGKVHAQVREDLLKADAKAIAKTIVRDLARPVLGFNRGWDRTRVMPTFEFVLAEAEDEKAKAETYGTLVERVGLPIPASHVYEIFNIPAPKDGEVVLSRPAAGAPAPQPMRAHPGRSGLRPLAQKLSPQGQQIESLVLASVDEAAAPVGALVDPLVAIVEQASDFDDLRDRLLAAYTDLDAGSFEDLMARAVFMAELAGRANA